MKRLSLLLAMGIAVTFAAGAWADDSIHPGWSSDGPKLYSQPRTAIEPSHWGPYGNPEEPATRPFKAFWRGLKAFRYQFKTTVIEGETKAGYAGGGIQTFRGVRRGLVEIGAGTYMGMAGQYPLPVEKTHPANVFIDSDRRIAALADLPSTAGIFWLAGTGSVGTVFGPGLVTIAQSEVDRYAMSPEDRAKVARQAAKTSQQHWGPTAHDRNAPRPAGLKYVGEWKAADDAAKAEEKAKTGALEGNPYSGDMIKKARSGKIKDN